MSLAHHGILFLDELPEFKREVLEVLRQPLEDGKLTLTRAAASLTYPAHGTLVAAMNPCPCGYAGDSTHTCACQPFQVQRYLQRISGPLLDRIDIHIEVPRLQHEELLGRPQGEPSAVIRARVVKARQIRQARFTNERRPLYANGAMEAGQIRKYCPVDGEVKEPLRAAIQQLGLSARAYHRILKLSRTIADLAGSAEIGVPHVAGCPLGGRFSIARWTGGCGGGEMRDGAAPFRPAPPAVRLCPPSSLAGLPESTSRARPRRPAPGPSGC